MEKIRISAVSYLNTKPFLYGLENHLVKKDIDLSLDIPSVCAEKLINNEVDMGLIPVASIPFIEDAKVVTDYCIGANGKVKTVNLYSEVPLNSIEEILLDYQSRTSVSLIKILSQKLWYINPVWSDASVGYINKINGNKAGLVIGDRTFSLNNKFKYTYDLAEEWFNLTKLPFVFAAWVSNKELPEEFISSFNEALKFGVDNRHLVVDKWQNSVPGIDLNNYFDDCISYKFDEPKKEAMNLFLRMVNQHENMLDINN